MATDPAAALAVLVHAVRDHVRTVVETEDAEGMRFPPELVLPEGDSPFEQMARRFELGVHEQQVVALLLAYELCPRVRQSVRHMSTEAVADPTIDVVRRIVYAGRFDLRAWTELDERGPLRACGIVERTDGGGEVPENRQTLKVARRILALVHGDATLDPDVARIARIGDVAPELATLVVGEAAVARLRHGIEDSELVIAIGCSGRGRRSALRAIADRQVLEIDARRIDKDATRAQRQLRAVARECRLSELVPLVLHLDALDAERLELVELELHGLVLATSSIPIARRWSRPATVVELPVISGADRELLWRRALPMVNAADVTQLASLYPLAPGLIHVVGALALRLRGDAALDSSHIEAALRSVLDDRLTGVAKRITVTQTWDDLVLPPEQTAAVVEMLARIRHRTQVYETWGFGSKVGKGLGVTALFSGPPGTGKTMCAGLIAKSLGTELYQVDLSKIVSKWIGETEKNLANVFDAAEAGHAVLLFDEADALFGKRTEVRSSNDRHANQETNYLLQRLESFTGICILTTNHESAIDEAFRRRLTVHLRLPVPELEERRRLWSALLPAAAPVEDDLDFDLLADRYIMSGGYIKNAVVRAAFLAAQARSAITTQLLFQGAQLEYEAMGKLA